MACDDILTVFFATFSAVGIVSNVLVITAISRTPWLRTPMNYLLLNLAVSDVIISIFVLPRYVFFDVIGHQSSRPFLCTFFNGGSLIGVGTTAEGFTLISIAVERYVAVVTPHNITDRVTVRKLRLIVPLCWVVSTLATLPTLVSLSYDEDQNRCSEEPILFNNTANACLKFVLGISSVVAMSTINSLVVISLWKTNTTTDTTQNARVKMRKRVTKMLVIITNFHAFCRIPNSTLNLIILVFPAAKYLRLIDKITVLLVLINSASHPVLMCAHLSSFRKAIKRLLGCGRSAAAVNPTNQVESSL